MTNDTGSSSKPKPAEKPAVATASKPSLASKPASAFQGPANLLFFLLPLFYFQTRLSVYPHQQASRQSAKSRKRQTHQKSLTSLSVAKAKTSLKSRRPASLVPHCERCTRYAVDAGIIFFFSFADTVRIFQTFSSCPRRKLRRQPRAKESPRLSLQPRWKSHRTL